MQRLFWKLIGTFWLTTIVILTITVFVSFRLANQNTEENSVDPREIEGQLQSILQTDGISGFSKLTRDPASFPPGRTVYLVDQQGTDLLDRPIPEHVDRRARRIWSAIETRGLNNGDNRHWSRRLRQSLLEGPEGQGLLAMPGPAPLRPFGFFTPGSRWTILIVAAAISLLVFWLLSRSLTRPVVRITETAARLAAGDMSTRVGPTAHSSDEIGQLAVQFDRMAEELETQSKSRREMFRNIAHELRAPLTRLQIATELVERKAEQPPADLTRIRYEVEVIDTLAGQVLALAGAEAPLDQTATTVLNDVTGQIATDAQFEAASREVTLNYEAPTEQLRVRGNHSAIASAIENVVRNAIQHTPAGGEVSLIVSLGASGASCVVTDTGPGVPADSLPRIFEPFYRIDTNRPGAGIGLAITHRVIQLVGGEIEVSNRPTGGLQVTMHLPRA